jgi:serine protease inhibitor
MKLKYRMVGFAIYAVLLLSETSASAAGDLANANNMFAIDLYRQLANSNRNLVISPFSIDTALAMACVGARGGTAGEMAKVLHFSSENAGVNSEFAGLMKELNEAKAASCDIEMANSLWAQIGFPVPG